MTTITPLDFLQTRRSVKVADLIAPGPDPQQLHQILTLASRVPDHGRYVPWYFVVISGEARDRLGEKLALLFAARTPAATPAQIDAERTRFSRGPTVVAVVSRIREGKNSQWEQILCAGAVCYNLCLAANACGFGTNWLTGWYSTDPQFKDYLGVAPSDNIAGFIFIGTAHQKQDDRERPDLSRIVTEWSEGVELNTGEGYGQPGAGLPDKGFV